MTVVIPVHNRTEFLRAALESVLAQDYRGRVQVLVVDDGSTVPVEAGFAARYPMVTFLRQANRGEAAARQLGSEQATTEFIAYLDDDDIWVNRALSRQVEHLRAEPHVGMVWSDIAYLRLGRRPGREGWYRNFATLAAAPRRAALAGVGWVYPRGALVSHALLHEPAYPSALLVRRNFLDRIGGWSDSAGRLLICFDMFMRATRAGRVGFNPEVLTYIRRGHQQVTSDLHRSRLEQSRTLHRWVSQDPDREITAPLLARRFLRIGYGLLRQGRPDLSIEYGIRALALAMPYPMGITRRPWVPAQ